MAGGVDPGEERRGEGGRAGGEDSGGNGGRGGAHGDPRWLVANGRATIRHSSEAICC